MKRKSDLTSSLDDMFCEDEKKRISSIKMLEQIATALGPQRTRDQLVPFLNQFWEDQPSIMLAVVNQISNLKSYLGGSEYQRLLLSTLIGFCSSDEIEVAMIATNIMISILTKATDQYVDVIKKLVKVDMNVAKQCVAIIIISGVQKLPHLSATFIQIYKSMAFSQKPAVRIIAAKYLNQLCERIVNKEQITGIIQILYNDSEDLPKLLTIDTLVLLYPVNSNFVMNKLKMLICLGKWRFNLKLCEYAQKFSEVLTKSHFKILLEPAFMSMLVSSDIQIRAHSCCVLIAVAKNMTAEQNSTKLLPIIESLSIDKSISVKKNISKYIVGLFPSFGSDKIKQKLLPIIINLLKENNLQISTGIIENFKELAKELKSNENLQSLILSPLSAQLLSQDWRLRSNILTILGKMLINENILLPALIDLFINGCLDRVEAIRNISVNIIIDVINKNTGQWCKSQLLPKLLKIRDSKNYLVRQKIITIVQMTVDQADKNIVNQYKNIINLLLCDKIPNVRMIAMKVALSKQKLFDKPIQAQLCKMKDDSDTQIRQYAKLVRA